MRKKISIIVMFILLLIITGCSLNINLTINDKYKIKENAKISIENNIILLGNNSVKAYLNSLISSYHEYDYKIKKFIGDDESGLIFSLDYTNINNFIKRSDYNSLYLNSKLDIKDNVLNFKSGEGDFDSLFGDGPDPLAPSLDELKINIKFYNEVIENNADSYDKKNNTYTWIITNEKRPESISFKTSKKIRYDIMIKDLIEEYFVYAIMFCIVIVLIVFVVLGFKKKITICNDI